MSKVVNLFADLLVRTPDRRIAAVCLTFLLSDSEEEQKNDIDDADSDGETVGEAVNRDEISKLYNQLR